MRKVFLVYIVTVCMMVTVALAGPPQVVWNKVYDGGGDDYAYGVAADVSGNVYVTGSSKGSYDWSYCTIKYDTDGNLQWNKVYEMYNWHLDNDVAVDALGNVYVIGTDITSDKTRFVYRTIKYDTDGNIQWNHIYNSGKSSDIANSVAVDVSGNVYVTGYFYDTHYACDYRTLKYDTDGYLQWDRTYDLYGNTDEANGVAVDTLGNVYVTGRSDGVTSEDYYWTLKYDTDGNIQWSRTYNSGDYYDYAEDVAVDALGNVYVIGYSNSRGGTGRDYCTIKYDTDGNLQWVKFYDSDNDDLAHGVAVDALCNVYVTGETLNGTGADYCTIKYDTDGNLQWETIYDSGGDDVAYGVAVDASNNVYVTGCFHDRYILDYRTIKYAQDDTPVVMKQPKADNLQLKVLRNITSNPVLQYMLPPNTNGNLVLYSSDGCVVEKFLLTEPESSVIFDCSLPSGVYFAKLTTESGSTIAKVVLVK